MTHRRKRLLLYSSPLVFVLALGLYGTSEVGRLQSEAELLATQGQAIQRLLRDFAQGLQSHDMARVSACYDPTFAGLRGGLWQKSLRSDRDGARVYDLQPGIEGARATPADLARHILGGADVLKQARFKLERVEHLVVPESETEGGRASLRAILWLRGHQSTGTVFETKAAFRLELAQRDGQWRIRDQTLLGGTTVLGDRRGFVDVAADAGIDFRARHNPFFDSPEWQPERFGIIRYGSAGVSAIDVDGDGWDDLFFADGHRPRFYRNITAAAGDPAPGTEGSTLRFVEATEAAGLPAELPGVNVALFLDFDNDGDRDLFLGRFMGGNRLYRNDGPSPGKAGVSFTDVSEGAGLGDAFVVAASAADYDGDGDLDLYLGRYLDPRTELPTTLFYTRNGQGNSLLRNDGNLRFTEVTEVAGVAEGGLSLGIAWGDLDEDGAPDLYVANDFGRNALLRNNNDGTFTDVSAETGTLDFGFGMSTSLGDVDNDGDLDVYVSNVRSGQRWYSQATTLYTYLVNSLRQGTIREDFGLYREIYGFAGADWHDFGDRMVKGNSLLLNRGGDDFVDIAESSGANPFGWYWASTFFDYDNDGWLDLYAANGWISGTQTDDL